MADKPYSATNHAWYFTTDEDITFSTKGEIDGDFIILTLVNDSVSSVEGAKGDTQDSIRVAKLANTTVATQWGSDLNDNFNYVSKRQEDGNFMKRAELKRISNTENVTIASGVDPKIMKIPDYTLGTTAGDRSWTIKISKLNFLERTAPA